MPLPPSAAVLIQTHNREVDYVDGGVTYYKTFGIFKDDAGTDPVTDEGDEIATSKDFAGIIQTLQPVLAKRGIMLYADAQPGVPCYDGDGGDDWAPLTGGPLGGQVTYSALLRSKTATFNNYYSIIDYSGLNGTGTGKRWGYLESGSTQFGSGAVAVFKDGVSLAFPFDLGVINEWMAVTVTTSDAEAVLRGLIQLEQFYYGDCQIIAIIMHDPAETAEVQAYLETLKPGNVTPATTPSGNALLPWFIRKSGNPLSPGLI